MKLADIRLFRFHRNRSLETPVAPRIFNSSYNDIYLDELEQEKENKDTCKARFWTFQ